MRESNRIQELWKGISNEVSFLLYADCVSALLDLHLMIHNLMHFKKNYSMYEINHCGRKQSIKVALPTGTNRRQSGGE